MHDWVEVVGVFGVVPTLEKKVDVEGSVSHQAVFSVDVDVLKGVSPLLFMPKTKSMHDLVQGSNTLVSKRYCGELKRWTK